VEECWRTAGLGGDIAHRIHEACFETLLAPVRRLAGLDVPMPYARSIEQLCIPSQEAIIKTVQEMMA
jgi:pyruvate dehydrogenase E1 component beta subunit